MNTQHDAGQHVEGAPHASLREYTVGFWLSVVLTIIPFWLVLADVLASTGLTIFVIISFGTIQMLVHMIYFLHLNTKSEGGWVLISLAFSVMLVVITIAGSIWITFHLDRNMMPMMPEPPARYPDTMTGHTNEHNNPER